MSKNRATRRRLARPKNSRKPKDRFEVVTDEIKIRLQQENIHGIIYMGKGDGVFAGGLVGDVQVIGETLLTACLQNDSVLELFNIIVKTAKKKKNHEASKLLGEKINKQSKKGKTK